MKQNSGIIMIVLGALLLLIAYFSDQYIGTSLCETIGNWYTVLSLLLIIGGIITHIVITKKN